MKYYNSTIDDINALEPSSDLLSLSFGNLGYTLYNMTNVANKQHTV